MNSCAVDWCDKPLHMKQDVCSMHYQRRLHGRPMDKFPKGQSPNYTACHLRVERAKGKARDYPCIDCGGVAAEWSYNRMDPDGHTGVMRHGRSKGWTVQWSGNPIFYEPRCVGCHRRFDIGWEPAGQEQGQTEASL